MEPYKEKLHFASDYMAGAHPKVLEALVRTNALSTPGYGEDLFCRSAEKQILEACGCPEGEVHFLMGGTQTNAVVIDALLLSYQGVIAAETGHVSVHEAGAIEYGGHKVLCVPQEAGKLSAESVRREIRAYREDANREHMVMPGMVYLSQPTEYGTLYSLAELTEISTVCHENGLYLYIDGARLAYALAAPENDVTLRDLAALIGRLLHRRHEMRRAVWRGACFAKEKSDPALFQHS
jgi:threonine aldolase